MQEVEAEMENRRLLLSFLLPLHRLHSIVNPFAHPEFGKQEGNFPIFGFFTHLLKYASPEVS